MSIHTGIKGGTPSQCNLKENINVFHNREYRIMTKRSNLATTLLPTSGKFYQPARVGATIISKWYLESTILFRDTDVNYLHIWLRRFMEEGVAICANQRQENDIWWTSNILLDIFQCKSDPLMLSMKYWFETSVTTDYVSSSK